jgi:xanthine dehydrogenase FAD-binding subunit
MVKHIIPISLRETLSYLNDGDFQVIAGGTDLMIQNRNSADLPANLKKNTLFIFNLKELNYINEDDNDIKIGAVTTYKQILSSPIIPLLMKKIIEEIGSPGIRNAGTLAGNIGNASPAGDSLVGLYLLNAKVVLVSIDGERIVPIEQIIIGPRKTTINNNELIKEIIIPKTNFTHIDWVKVGGRRADAISKVAFAGAYFVHNDIITDFRLTLGAVAPTVIRNVNLEAMLIGQKLPLKKTLIDSIIINYEKFITPIDDQRSTKEYRKYVAANLIKNFISNIKAETK